MRTHRHDGLRSAQYFFTEMKHPASNKILIVLPFWNGDRAQAFKLARLLADLEPEHSNLADFLFVARFDCKHGDQTVKYVSRKFNVSTYTSKKRGIGWPAGCNSLFFGGMEWIYHKIASKQIPGYKAVFNMGADCAPLSRNWLKQLTEAWDEEAKKKPLYVAGPMVPGSPIGRSHINGDAQMTSGDLKFLKWLAMDVGDIRVAAGWDWLLSADFERWGWADLPFIKSYWRYPGEFPQSEWDVEVSRGTSFIHGVKGDSLLDLARKNLL